MKVISITLENFKAVKKAEINLNGAHVIVMGKNNIGKSSIGRLVSDLLTKNTPPKPLTEGEKKGYCQVKLEDGSVINYNFDEESQRVSLITAEGEIVSSVGEIFKRLSGKGMGFNIDTFLALSPKPRRDALVKMAGIDFSELDAQYQLAYADRTEKNMIFKTQQARIKPYAMILLQKEKLDISELSNKYAQAVAFNQDYDTKAEKLVGINNEIAQVDKLMSELQEKKSELSKMSNETALYLHGSAKILTEALNEMKRQIASCEADNFAIDEAKRLHKEYELAEKSETEAKEADKYVKIIEEAKQALLSKGKFPAGITVVQDDLLLDGLPFDSNQISTSRKMIASLEIAESMLGDVRYLHFDASILDKENAEKILEWATERDLQLCLERALWEGGELKYEIHEPKQA